MIPRTQAVFFNFYEDHIPSSVVSVEKASLFRYKPDFFARIITGLAKWLFRTFLEKKNDLLFLIIL